MTRNSRVKVYKSFFALLDLFLVNAAFILAFRIKFGTQVPDYNWNSYTSVLPWLSIVTLIIFYMFDLYSNWRRKSLYNLIYLIVLAVATLGLSTMALTFWYRGFSFPRSVIVLSMLLQVIFLIMTRMSIWWLAKRRYGLRKVLIIDSDLERGVVFAHKFLSHAAGWFVVHRFLSVKQWRAHTSMIEEVDVVLLSPSLVKDEKAEILSHCARCRKEVLIVPELFELFILDAEPQQIDDMLVLSIQPPGLTPAQLFMKRTFDVVVSGLLLCILSPIMLCLYIVVPLNSKGKAIFKQERMGKNGHRYMIYKFRSMVEGAEKLTGPIFATDKDPRITSFGRFIRATRLDELPQLFNVLKGDMSLVGPRPERQFFIEQFERSIRDYSYRMSVKPGVTGLAQIMAKYSTNTEDKLRFDLMYVRNYSFALDIKILLQTIRVLFQSEQARGISKEYQDEQEVILKQFGYSEVASSQADQKYWKK
ncbi:sugar transferase [Aneurinibacillus sp. REN35]|uniref:sugar transferase n=1 Tax=Aneurinibacillus sp. REN35 TaxID=3237286 RepID=UPI003528B9ED